MSDAAASLFDSLKDKLPKNLTSVLISAAFFGGTLLINLGGKATHFADVQAQQERRIADLEEAVKKDQTTRGELLEFKNDTKERLTNIEQMFREELKYHHPPKP